MIYQGQTLAYFARLPLTKKKVLQHRHFNIVAVAKCAIKISG